MYEVVPKRDFAVFEWTLFDHVDTLTCTHVSPSVHDQLPPIVPSDPSVVRVRQTDVRSRRVTRGPRFQSLLVLNVWTGLFNGKFDLGAIHVKNFLKCPLVHARNGKRYIRFESASLRLSPTLREIRTFSRPTLGQRATEKRRVGRSETCRWRVRVQTVKSKTPMKK